MLRKAFIGLIGATAAASVPRQARAEGPYAVDGEVSLGAAGSVRLLRFQPERARGFVECTAAVLRRDNVGVQVVSRAMNGRVSATVAEIARQYGAIVAINGGYFGNTYRPEGLLIVRGVTVSPARADYSGVLKVTRKGDVSIASSHETGDAFYAVQGKPTLIEPGGIMGMRRNVVVATRRTFVAESSDAIIFGETSPVSLYHLADLMMQYPDAFGVNAIDAALNLSGDATSAMSVPLPGDEELGRAATWVNRDFVIATPRFVPQATT